MATYYVDSRVANDAGAGTIGDPWKYVPGMASSTHSVVAFDTVYVNANSTFNESLTVSANDLTFRAYDINTSNKITVTHANARGEKVTKTYVSNPGVQEGMWTIDVSALDTVALSTSSRQRLKFYDMRVIGKSDTGGTVRVTMAVASSATDLATFFFERCHFSRGTNTCVTLNGKNITMRYCVVTQGGQDCVTLPSHTNNQRRGPALTDYFYCCEMSDPNYFDPSNGGDPIQNTSDTDVVNGTVVIEQCFLRNASQNKNGCLLHGAEGGMIVKNNYFEGDRSVILLQGILGKVTISGNTFASSPGSTTQTMLPRIRFDYPVGANALGAAAVCVIKNNVIADANVTSIFLRTFLPSGGSAGDFAGKLSVRNNYVRYPTYDTNSFAAAISMYQASMTSTYNATFELEIKNNVFLGGDKAVILPSGVANNAKYNVQSNTFAAGATFSIGGTDYATVALFQAATSAATNNQTKTFAECLINANYTIQSGSPLKYAGVLPTLSPPVYQDKFGTVMNIPPSQGPVEFLRS